MSTRNRFLSIALILFVTLLLPQMANAGDVVVYTTFGAGQTFSGNALEIGNTWQPFYVIESEAAPFTPSQTVFLTQIDLAAGGPAQFEVLLRSDAGGVPGVVLESWLVAGNPPNPVTSVKDTLGLQLAAGTQYWVEMATTQPVGNGPQISDQWNNSPSATGTISLLNPDSSVTSITGYPLGNAANDAYWANLNACGSSCGLWLPAFDVLGQTASIPIPHFVGGAFGQTIQELVGPAPLGLSVEVNLGFVGPDGNSIGPNSTVTLGPGETAPLDLDVDTLVQAFGQRVEVRPVATVIKVTDVSLQPVNLIITPAVALREVTEVFDTRTGYGTVLVPGKAMYPANPIFELQGLAWEQTMRLIVSAFPANPCAATLSFVDSKGSPMGQSMQMDLKPGDTEWLDLNANTLGLKLGQRVEVQPIVTMTSPASSCQASVEVFDDVSGRTWTHQDPGSGGAQNLSNLPSQN